MEGVVHRMGCIGGSDANNKALNPSFQSLLDGIYMSMMQWLHTRYSQSCMWLMRHSARMDKTTCILGIYNAISILLCSAISSLLVSKLCVLRNQRRTDIVSGDIITRLTSVYILLCPSTPISASDLLSISIVMVSGWTN